MGHVKEGLCRITHEFKGDINMTQQAQTFIDPNVKGPTLTIHPLKELYVGTAFVKGVGIITGPVYIKMRSTRDGKFCQCCNTETGETETLDGKEFVTAADKACGFEIENVTLTFKRKK